MFANKWLTAYFFSLFAILPLIRRGPSVPLWRSTMKLWQAKTTPDDAAAQEPVQTQRADLKITAFPSVSTWASVREALRPAPAAVATASRRPTISSVAYGAKGRQWTPSRKAVRTWALQTMRTSLPPTVETIGCRPRAPAYRCGPLALESGVARSRRKAKILTRKTQARTRRSKLQTATRPMPDRG